MQEFYEHKKALGGAPEKAAPYYANPLYVAQHKLDGVRYHIYCNRQGNVKIYSRATSARTGDPVEKQDTLSHIADEARRLFGHGFVIDGELVAAKGRRTTFKDVTRISGSTPQRALQIQKREGFLRFAAFDVLVWDEQELIHEKQDVRLKTLYDAVPRENGSTFIYALDTAYTEEGKRIMREEVLSSEGEGLILKNLHGVYNPRRNSDWIKDKFVQHIDVVFLGIKMGTELSIKKGHTEATPTRTSGLAGSIRFGMYVPHTGILTEQDSYITQGDKIFILKEVGRTRGFDDEMMMDLTMNADNYVGRVFQVRGQMQYSDTWAIREPRFECWRNDKKPEECVVTAY